MPFSGSEFTGSVKENHVCVPCKVRLVRNSGIVPCWCHSGCCYATWSGLNGDTEEDRLGIKKMRHRKSIKGSKCASTSCKEVAKYQMGKRQHLRS